MPTLAAAKQAMQSFLDLIRSRPHVLQAAYVGSMRREDVLVGDADILVVTTSLIDLRNDLISFCNSRGYEYWVNEERRSLTFVHSSGIEVDVYGIRNTEKIGARYLFHTGSIANNVLLRRKALLLGYDLTPEGLVDSSGNIIAGDTETEIFAALGEPETTPDERTR